MKKALFLIAACCLMLGACAQNKTQNTQTKENNMKKTLIVYFSATGTTKAAAQRLAKEHSEWLLQRPQEGLSSVHLGREQIDELREVTCKPCRRMNIEDYRDFCLSLGDGIEEKFPFSKFKNGEGVLVFYVCGHMFSYFDWMDCEYLICPHFRHSTATKSFTSPTRSSHWANDNFFKKSVHDINLFPNFAS